MKTKRILLQLLFRFSFLLVPLFSLYLRYTFSYDPHARCEGEDHRHTGGPVGYVIIAGWGYLVDYDIDSRGMANIYQKRNHLLC